ncbi:MAG: acetate kinase [Patescibacteria group bacterium]|nr:acetate kinase [Patescibacteria group bacterium]
MMILVINSGSSSLKFRLYDDLLRELAGGLIERLGQKNSFMEWQVGVAKKRRDYSNGIENHERGLVEVFATLKQAGFNPVEIASVGHRVVHGGEEFVRPTIVTKTILKRIAEYNRLAPLHNPANLKGIASCMKLLPRAKNVAVFDTAFYRTLPDYAYMYALPWDYYRQYRIRKYGFHGISHEYVTREAARLLKRPYSKLKLVSCHLGSGASVTAVKNGQAVETTMGFTPLEGLTMSTRCGDIDPAIPTYLMRELGLTANQVDDVLNRKSGIYGLTGFKDLRDVLTAAGERVPGYRMKRKVTPELRRRCRLALDVFCYDIARYIGQFAAVMGGIDAVVFTAGVGERSEIIRRRVLKFISLPKKAKVLVVPTNEELMIARETRRLA